MSKDWNYNSGQWWVLCDVCGKKTKSSEIKQRWDGFLVCKEDYENRHPQDFIRVKQDKIVVPFSRPRTTDTFSNTCDTPTAIAGYAQAGCAIAGVTTNAVTEIPQSSFNGTTL